VKVGFEKGSGDPVEVRLMHTVIAGITRSGKSETTQALIQRSGETRFLIFDVKDPRDYKGVGVDVPIYVQEKTDPLMLKRLLESQSHLSLKFEFPELIRVCKHEDTWHGILDGINQSLEEGRHPIVENKLLVLQHLLRKLVSELEETPISDRLELKSRVNVMDLSRVSRELQQLAVHSTLKWVLEHERDLVIVLDEAHRFVPEQGSNASKEIVTQVIREGGAKGLWMWIVDQTITGVDKQVLKQCWIWILGKQRELNEAKRTLQQIPFRTGLTEKDIMRLAVGHFVVCTDDFAKIVYVWPSWLPEDVAVKVACGEVSVEEAINFKSRLWREDEELVWKEKYESLEERYKQLEKENRDLRREISLLKKTIEDLSERTSKEKVVCKGSRIFKRSSEEPETPGPRAQIPPSTVFNEARFIALIDQRLNERLLEAEDVRVVRVDVDDRIRDMVKEDFITAVISKIETLPEPAKKAARYIYEKRKVGIGELYFFLYQKTGRPPGSFYNNVTKPLEAAALIKKSSGEIEWAMDDLLLNRFKDFVKPEDLESMRNYLLSLLL